MLPNLNKIKGVHPGDVLKRELKKRNISASKLASSIGEHKQTISAILNKRRNINPKLSLKLATEFNVDQDYFMIMQARYDVKELADSLPKDRPNVKHFREVLFWDTSLDKIDWNKNKNSVIRRVLERGNESEINELISFYGRKTVSSAIISMNSIRLSSFNKNVLEYDLI